jgi:hypothetical protein
MKKKDKNETKERNEIKDTQAEIEEIQGIMRDNIDKVLESGVKLGTLGGTVETTRIEAVNFKKNAEETYLSAANSNYGIGIISLFACFGAALSLLTQQPWPFHIIMFAIFGAMGYAVNQVRNMFHGAWLRAKLFGESVLPSQQNTDTPKHHFDVSPSFLPTTALGATVAATPTATSGIVGRLSHKLGF